VGSVTRSRIERGFLRHDGTSVGNPVVDADAISLVPCALCISALFTYGAAQCTDNYTAIDALAAILNAGSSVRLDGSPDECSAIGVYRSWCRFATLSVSSRSPEYRAHGHTEQIHLV
jgi:hypothetical protein